MSSDKFAKQKGAAPARDARKTDKVPPRPTPKKAKRGKVYRCFGFEARSRSKWTGLTTWTRWSVWGHAKWYPTFKSRDQAMKMYHGFFTDPDRYEVQVRPVQR